MLTLLRKFENVVTTYNTVKSTLVWKRLFPRQNVWWKYFSLLTNLFNKLLMEEFSEGMKMKVKRFFFSETLLFTYTSRLLCMWFVTDNRTRIRSLMNERLSYNSCIHLSHIFCQHTGHIFFTNDSECISGWLSIYYACIVVTLII